MKTTEKDSYVLSLNLYNTVLESLKKKDKHMFKLLNKSGKKYKNAIYWYMRRLIGE